jgi:hypothetical protein
MDLALNLFQPNANDPILLLYLQEMLKLDSFLDKENIIEVVVNLLPGILHYLVNISSMSFVTPFSEAIESIHELFGPFIVLNKRYGCVWAKSYAEAMFGSFSVLPLSFASISIGTFAIIRRAMFFALEKFPHVKFLHAKIRFSFHLKFFVLF